MIVQIILITLGFIIALSYPMGIEPLRFLPTDSHKAVESALAILLLNVGYILLGELGLLTLAAIPIGCGLGYGFAYMLTEGTANEMFRLPLHLDRASFGYAALVALATVALSAAVVTRKIFRLDIVSILKTKE